MLPTLSLALHLTIVGPIANLLSDNGRQETVGSIPELSIAKGGSQKATAQASPGQVNNVWLGGQANVGASSSKDKQQNMIFKSNLYDGFHTCNKTESLNKTLKNKFKE